MPSPLPAPGPPLKDALISSLLPKDGSEWARDDTCYLRIPVSNELPHFRENKICLFLTICQLQIDL